jgi:hypothetical protein
MLEKPSKWRAGLIGGVVIGTISGIPGVSLINCCCCAGIWLGGMLSMYLYKTEVTPEMQPLESSDALILGLTSGIGGAFVATLLSVMILALFGPVEAELMRSIMERVLERLEEGGTLPSEVVDQMRDQLEESLRDSSSVSGILGNLFITLIVFPIFAILGALLGYAIFRPKNRPSMTQTT